MQRPQAGLFFILLTALIDVMGIGIIIPILPQLVEELAGSPTAGARSIGWLMALYAVMQFIFSPLLGSLSDRYGRRPILLLSMLGMGLNYLLLYAAPSLAWLFVGRIIAGVTGASLTVANAYIADISTPENLSKNFGRLGAVFGLGFVLGPALGGLLGDYGLRIPFLFAAFCSLLNMLYGYFVLPESLTPDRRGVRLGRRDLNPFTPLAAFGQYPIIRSLSGAFVLLGLSNQVMFAIWVLYTEQVLGWTTKQNGVALAVYGLLSAVVQAGLISRSIKLLGEKKTIIVGLLFAAAEFVMLSVARSSTTLYLSLLVGALGGLAGPALQGLISRQVPNSEQGRVQGAIASLNSLVGVVGPVIATTIYAYFNGGSAWHFPGAAFIWGALCALAGTVMAASVLRHFSQAPATHQVYVEPTHLRQTEVTQTKDG